MAPDMPLPDRLARQRRLLAVALVSALGLLLGSQLSLGRPLIERPPSEALESLCSSARAQAGAGKLSGGLAALERLEVLERRPGDAEFILSLADRINAGLASHSRWKLLAPPGRKDRVVAAVNERIRAGELDPEAVSRVLDAGRLRGLYLAEAAAHPVEGSGTDYVLSLRVLDLSGKIVAMASETFSHPRAMASARWGRGVAAGLRLLSLAAGGLAASWLAGTWLYLWLRRRSALASLPEAMADLERYMANGDAVTALRLADSLLEVLPERNDLFAFRQRLMDLTQGDPGRYQRACVETRKLESALRQAAKTGSPLSIAPPDRLALADLLPHHPELRLMLGRVEDLTRQERGRAESERDMAEALSLVRRGRLAEARARLEAVFKRTPDDPGAAKAARDLDAAADHARRLEEEAARLLERGRVAQAEQALQRSAEADSGRAGAKLLLDQLQSSRSSERLVLEPDKTGKRVVIVKQDHFTIGRADADIRIDDPRVSKRHLKVSILEDAVVAEDLASANGTSHCGERLGTARLEDGDILCLAGTYRFEARILRSHDSLPEATVATGPSREPRPAAGRNGPGTGPVSCLLLSGERQDILALRREARCSAKDLGLSFGASGDCAFVLEDGVVLFLSPQGPRTLCPGAIVERRGLRFRVAAGR